MGARKVALTTEEFIARAQAVHGNRYDYSRVVYVNNKTPVEVICPDHGPFFPKPNNHVANRSGCPRCTHCPPTSLDTFLARARAVHGERYDYSRVVYTTVQTHVEIICPEHGPFWQIPLSHTQGRGCQQCGAKQCVRRKDTAWFIERAQSVHGERYNYGQVNYRRAQEKVTIGCPRHGLFEQVASYHLAGNGCPACAGVKPLTQEEFVRRAQAVHGDRYDYSHVNYSGMHSKVTVICRDHGPFQSLAKDHYAKGCGCPACARESSVSDLEQEIADWLTGLGLQVVHNDLRTLRGFEVDLLVPERRLGIEVNGAYWHSEAKLVHPRMHEMKLARAEQEGYRLIFIWDFDWLQRRPLIEAHLRHALGLSLAPRHHARQCQVLLVANHVAADFYDRYHIQGKAGRALLHYGLLHNGEMLACMSFHRAANRRLAAQEGEWELLRFATRDRVPGAASRLFAAFRREHHPQVIWSFSDRQHFSGALYEQLGFQLDGRLPADYRLIHQPPLGRIWHKAAWQRKHIPTRLAELGIEEPFDPATDPRTEREMQDLAKVHRIMDAGKIRWKWTAPA